MKYPIFEIKEEIITELTSVLQQLHYPTDDVNLEIPPDENMGDFAFPCFSFCPISKKSPQLTAQEIADELKVMQWVKKTEVKGGYINFFINEARLIESTIPLIIKKKNKYGVLEKKNKKVIIEHTSANPNGPLHVGRARNPIIGDTLVRIFKAAGYQVESQFYLDDLGKQVAILAWGVKNLRKNEVPPGEIDKPDHQMVGFYQTANERMTKDEKIAEEIGEIVRKSEQGDQRTLETVKNAYTPVLEGINKSLKTINITIDKYVPESTFVRDKSVEQVIETLKTSEYCSDENGAYFLDLKPFGVQGRNTKFFITRSDGTSLYATRDIAYHVWKAKQADVLINVLGEDHKLEAKQVEIGLKLLGETRIPTTIFYSFVSLPGGKMSTRRGRVVYLDQLITECIHRAYNEVKKRRGDELSPSKMKEIAEIIGVGALRYNIIKVQPEKDMVFKWEEALNFEGNASPFIQYAYARASGILSKLSEETMENVSPGYQLLTHESEIKLVKQLAQLPEIIYEAYRSYRPHIIPAYLFETASQFNQFYRDCPVLSEQNTGLKKARLELVQATKIVIKNGLELLGISAPEEM